MARLPVLTVPDSRLREVSKPVSIVDDHIRKILADMMETMYAEEGCGLAAIQVGIPLRMLVIDLSEKGKSDQIYKMINPEIFWYSKDQRECREGCLSVPEQRAEVSRPAGIKMRYLDEHGVEKTLESDEFLATCVQHEIDHLNGKVFLDHLSPLKRTMMVNRAKRIKRAEKEAALD